MAQRKISLVIGHGQSNETATSVKFGAPSLATAGAAVNYIQLHGIIETKLSFKNDFSYQLAENMTRIMKIPVKCVNKAISGSSVVSSWAGIASGTGATAIPKRPGDSGYDPNGYVQSTYNAVETDVAAGYEVWNLCVLGGNDIAAQHSASSIAQAHIDIISQVLAKGATHVFVGLVHGRTLSNPTDYSLPTGRQAVARNTILTNFSANTKVKAGIDMSAVLDTAFKTDTESHLNHMGSQLAAKMWLNVFRSYNLM